MNGEYTWLSAMIYNTIAKYAASKAFPRMAWYWHPRLLEGRAGSREVSRLVELRIMVRKYARVCNADGTARAYTFEIRSDCK